MTKSVKLNARQIGELESRDFLGEETWKRWKQDYDACMGYRKTLKGKPTDEQRVLLDWNDQLIEFYGSRLFHSVQLAGVGKCECTRCGKRRAEDGIRQKEAQRRLKKVLIANQAP